MDDLHRALRDRLVQEYHRLGCRTTELVQLFGLARATVQRAVGASDGLPAPLGRHALTELDQWVFTAFWYEVAGRWGLDPPELGPPFLRAFCPFCSSGQARNAHERPESDPGGLALGASDVAEGSLEDVYHAAGLLCRRAGHAEHCVTGAARFMLVCDAFSRNPWTVGLFMTQHVSKRGCSVRTCIRCGYRFVSPSPAHKHCGCPPEYPGPWPLTIARLARTELSVR